MKIVHLNLDSVNRRHRPRPMTDQERFNQEMNYKFFKKACQKYAGVISEVKEFFPDWEPKF